jgi:hypothetical protein
MRLALAGTGIAVFFTGCYGFIIPQGRGNTLQEAIGMKTNNAKIQEALKKTPREIPDSVVNNSPNFGTGVQDGADYSVWQGTHVTKASGRMYEIVKQLSHDPQAFT